MQNLGRGTRKKSSRCFNRSRPSLSNGEKLRDIYFKGFVCVIEWRTGYPDRIEVNVCSLKLTCWLKILLQDIKTILCWYRYQDDENTSVYSPDNYVGSGCTLPHPSFVFASKQPDKFKWRKLCYNQRPLFGRMCNLLRKRGIQLFVCSMVGRKKMWAVWILQRI